MATLNPILTATPGNPLTYNVGMAETFSWIPVENDADRPIYARATYTINAAGQGGLDIISGATTRYGNYSSIYTLSSTKIQSLTASNSNTSGIEALTLPAGITISGTFTGIQLTFGAIVAYK